MGVTIIMDMPLLTIRRAFPRPDPTLVDSFRNTAVGLIIDAMGGRGGLGHMIKPVSFSAATPLCGVAVTCHLGPGDDLALYGAIDAARRGDILVADADEFTGTSVADELVLAMAANKRVAGFVTDGLVRDIAGIEALGLPVFAAGVSANAASHTGPGTVGLSIVIGGVAVAPGDIIVADRDGVVAVPLELAGRVLGKLADVRKSRVAIAQKVAAGMEIPEFATAILRSNRVVEVP